MPQQRKIVRARLYEARKQNQILNLKQFQNDRVAKFATREGHAATAREVATETGVSWRNLDEQRALVIGRLYKAMKKAPHRPKKDENAANFTAFSGSDATAKEVGSQIGVSAKSVRNAAKFTDALEVLEQVSPEGDKGQW